MSAHARPVKRLRRAGRVALAATWVSLIAAPALGHSFVKSTSPKEGAVLTEHTESVTVRFTGPIETSLARMLVLGPGGARADLGRVEYLERRGIRVALSEELPNGEYVVAWRVIAADGHVQKGRFGFGLDAPTPLPTPTPTPTPSDRVLGTTMRRGQAEDAEEAPLAPRLLLGVVRWLTFASLLVLAGAVAWRTGLLDKLVRPPDRDALSSPVLVGAPAARPASQPRPAPSRVTPGLTVAAGSWVAALLLSIGLAGHAGTTDPVALNLGADLLHVLAASTWGGGLVVLLAVAFPSAREQAARDRLAVLAPVISRFSDLAVISIGALVASGVFRSWIGLERVSDLTGTPYGRALLFKLIVFVPVLILGGINNRVTKPAFERALEQGLDERGALDRLRRLVTFEVGLALLIVALTALLVNLPPPGGNPMHSG